VQVWYHVGSKDEAPGKAGFAHMFEHLMFKGSAHVGPGEWDTYIERSGGSDNADTYFDRTRYYETVPSNALDRVLWLEADRMISLRVDDPNMKSERAVVEEEHRQDVENAPYGLAGEKLINMLYPASHPYGHSTIGVMADLDNAVLKDVQAFHDEYYKPNDATLIVVGDFKTADALPRIRQYFGPIPKATKPFTRYPAPPVEQTAERRETLTDKLATLPQITLSFRLPPIASPETPAFDVMSQILSAGESSRLYRTLVRDKQIATNVDGSPQELKLGGWFSFSAIVNAGKKPEEVEKALEEQIELLRTQPVSAYELEKAKNQAVAAKVFGDVSTAQKATDLGEADLDYGTPDEVNHELAKLSAVTAADIQRVAQKYFAPNLRNVLTVLPAAGPSQTGDAQTGATHQEAK
jgi:zinc protease